MKTAALVPVRGLAGGKSRLLPHLDGSAVEQLCLAMLRDVLEALRGVPEIDRVAVTTPDPRVAECARREGALALDGPPGLNPAVEAGAREFCAADAAALLVVLGDVPGARSADLRALLRAGEQLGERAVLVAPSGDGGSSALLRRPHDAIPAAFGPNSADAHRAHAERLGVPFRALPLPSLDLDLDRIGDLTAFLRRGVGGEHTRAVIRELRVGGAS